MYIQDSLFIGVLIGVAVGAYVLGVLSYCVFTRYSSKAANRNTITQKTHTDHPGKASSYGIDGSFTPVRAGTPSHFSFTKQYNYNAEGHAIDGSLSLGARGDEVPLQSGVELGPHPGKAALSPPYLSPPLSNFAQSGLPQIPGSAATSSQSLITATLVSPAIPRRPTENLKPVPLVKILPVTSEQPTPVNLTQYYPVPVPSSPVMQRPASPVAWHLPSRSRSMTKLQEDSEHEHSDSKYGIAIPSPGATPDTEGKNQPIVLDVKIFEASQAPTPGSSVCSDPLLPARDSTPSPMRESVIQLYESFPVPPDSNPNENIAETRPRTTSGVRTIRAPAPTTTPHITAPPMLKRPVRPLTIQTYRGGSVSTPLPQHQGLPSRPHTASQAGAFLVPTSRPSSASSQITLVSPKRIPKSMSARGSLVSLTEDSFLMPPRTPPTPRSPSQSSLRPKTPPRPMSSRNTIYIGSGSNKPQPEDRLSFECIGELNATFPAAFTPRSL